ncbi:MAG: WecB/TagA/CpsF family glycosyltransferase [Prevotella sp.]|nr:WecB/TagA/CpsF family glycosyltransferase [Prevotella sp.]MDD7068399.1 WecB/TagA/CpsF family glycosyltransferase [Prevotella sp.]MDY4538640.1 WecB/TagA/CpsF family glycosyltransferase [Prevotella sp.]MDY5288740.1 WecB/TagA/CpsF family glycosyltransferase [Prevotella sp.]
MRMKLKDLDILTSRAELAKLPEGKLLINTINAFSYDNARKDVLFSEALQKGDVLIPDGISIVKACRFLNAKSQPKERIAGWDLFVYEMEKLNRVGGKVMFLGSSDAVLNLIRQRVAEKYPKIEVDTYSPPYKPEFSDEDNEAMISAINHSNPDLLWIGMTAPKQEKWAYTYLDRLDVHCHIGTIGAVFDFFAGTVKRAPERWQRAGLEWLYRLLSEPRRMWRRYFIGNAKFIYYIMLEKIM